ncbi:unnamed protein product [Periconia digitata]|uniref:AA1-like domain-containing protein n=1 Tax=Periconia digitata TaxID=1303443 RepID=A0A9W4XCP8_9PLEO|nr:unnamed protein product [Periconia digitata]
MYSSTLLLLASPLALAASLPPRALCLSTLPLFIIPNLEYSSLIQYSNPAHMSVSRANIDFNITGHTTSACAGAASGQTSSGAFFAFPSPIDCNEADGSAIETTFSYAGPSRTLQINETWICEGDQYLATATQALDLSCKGNLWQNPEWTEGEIYSSESVTCAPARVTMEPKITKVGPAGV